MRIQIGGPQPSSPPSSFGKAIPSVESWNDT